MMRHYIHSFRIFQPQPSRGKKRRILTISKPHTAGNTSSREDNTALNRSNKIQHRDYKLTSCSPWFLLIPGPILRSDFLQSMGAILRSHFLQFLVPADSGSYPQIRLSAVPGSYWFRVLSSDQTFCSPWFLLIPGPILRSHFLQFMVPADSGSYPQIRLSAVPGSCWFHALSAVHDQTFCSPWFLLVPGPILRSDPRSLWICRFRVPKQSQCLQLLTPAGSGSSLHNKSQQHSDPMGAAITAVDDIHTSILITPPHMRKMQGSQAGHNIFRPGLQFGQILKTGGVKSNGSTKKHAPTTLLPLFPATNADIPPKEIKAFYPLQETQDPCLSKSPRLHPSTSCKKRKFPVKDEYHQILMGQSISSKELLGLRTMHPADECRSSLKHQQVHLRRTLRHWEKPTWTGKQILSSTKIQDQGLESYKITFEQVQMLEVLFKTPVYHLEKRLSSRFYHGPGLRRNQKKGSSVLSTISMLRWNDSGWPNYTCYLPTSPMKSKDKGQTIGRPWSPYTRMKLRLRSSGSDLCFYP
ncbi:LOW QUALITY PROTEIN: hypothetical protein HID58_065854 [Brassica napus]|uniref:Uncharacterized protein n=1 Tax=Brassica napus TaxID=3708 RepID=A0ABQ7ZE16_BRANA|nr:LOW QUALITY PROTEIN: hypothetical protein HID58_065854 [Brassica napus]